MAFLDSLTQDEKAILYYRWPFWARPEQLPPEGDWRVWVYLAGRGAGKTRSGAEWVRDLAESGRVDRIALVAPTAADARDVLVEGESGIMAICPPWDRPKYEPSKRRVTWSNGVIATTYSADEPERLRGPQHAAALCDEVAAWRRPEAFDMLMFGLRLGNNPRVCITTTPKPVKLLKDLLKSPATVVSRGTTFDNAENLAPEFLADIHSRYYGSRLGRQELMAEILEDVPGALWTFDLIDQYRVDPLPAEFAFSRIVVAVDPSGGEDAENDEQGIVVGGLGRDGHGYVLADRSLKSSPDGWGRAAVKAYLDFKADTIVCESNFGGDMVLSTIRTAAQALVRDGHHGANSVPVKKIVASRGKRLRAEPIAALYEQGRIHHAGSFARLESQMAEWTPEAEKSPDRLDAAVWTLTELMLGPTVSGPNRVAQPRALPVFRA